MYTQRKEDPNISQHPGTMAQSFAKTQVLKTLQLLVELTALYVNLYLHPLSGRKLSQ